MSNLTGKSQTTDYLVNLEGILRVVQCPSRAKIPCETLTSAYITYSAILIYLRKILQIFEFQFGS